VYGQSLILTCCVVSNSSNTCIVYHSFKNCKKKSIWNRI